MSSPARIKVGQGKRIKVGQGKRIKVGQGKRIKVGQGRRIKVGQGNSGTYLLHYYRSEEMVNPLANLTFFKTSFTVLPASKKCNMAFM